jgi:DNA-binding NtrC family response regulator
MSGNSPPVKLVAIDDDPRSLELIAEALAQPALEILTSTDPQAGLEIVLRERPEVVLLDMVMPKLSGMDLLERIVEAQPGADVILMTAHYSTDSAVEAIRKGASDYLTKPISIAVLRQKLEKLLADARQRRRALHLERELASACSFEGMIGRSPLMLEVFARIRRVAPHFRTALVTGPTGAGKELVARALHRLSPAAAGPFAACNCSAVTESLFESELFGYVRGAFTGAVKDKVGLFEYASGGVLLLDEIGDMPLATQGKLLRVLQTQEVQRLGSPVPRPIDVRIVAATNRDLRALIAARQFRDDLYYRLSMVEILVPPLADRKEDLPLLERHLLERFSEQYRHPVRSITRRAQAVLARYHWPGNVRELENVLGNACMSIDGDLIDFRDLPERLRTHPAADTGAEEALLSLPELERRHVLRVLERVGGNKVRAAEILGISRATLYRILGETSAANA